MSAVIPIVDRAHAKLSASGSKKWLTCTPSAHLEEQFPNEDSDFSKEGTFAHAVFEEIINDYLGRVSEPLPLELLRYDTPALRDHVRAAADVAVEKIEAVRTACPDARILVEQRLDFSPWVPEGFGTGDLVVVADDELWVMDLKFGQGVFVNPVENSQMRLYALGAYNLFGTIYDAKHVRMQILQPRLNNYGIEELTVDELLAWAETVVKPAAERAWEGSGEFVAGEHCTSGFCKARFTCAARAEQSMAIAKQSFSLVKPDLLTQDQLLAVLGKADEAMKWLADVKTYALQQAKDGAVVPGYKLVEGRSVRKYADHDAVAQRLKDAGVEEAIIYERSLRGITAMEAVLGKKRFAEVLGELVEKPAGALTLVPESDKRAGVVPGAQVFSAIADDRS